MGGQWVGESGVMFKIENAKDGKFLSKWNGRIPAWDVKTVKLFPTFGLAQGDVIRLSELGCCVHIRPAGNQTAELNPARAQ